MWYSRYKPQFQNCTVDTVKHENGYFCETNSPLIFCIPSSSAVQRWKGKYNVLRSRQKRKKTFFEEPSRELSYKENNTTHWAEHCCLCGPHARKVNLPQWGRCLCKCTLDSSGCLWTLSGCALQLSPFIRLHSRKLEALFRRSSAPMRRLREQRPSAPQLFCH